MAPASAMATVIMTVIVAVDTRLRNKKAGRGGADNKGFPYPTTAPFVYAFRLLE